jgi:hypothetical protein
LGGGVGSGSALSVSSATASGPAALSITSGTAKRLSTNAHKIDTNPTTRKILLFMLFSFVWYDMNPKQNGYLVPFLTISL